MRLHWLAPLGVLIALSTLVQGGDLPVAPRGRVQVGYLMVPPCEVQDCRPQFIPYYPQAGDIFLYDEGKKLHHLAYRVVGTGPPTHSAVAYERDDCTTALLELVGPTVVGAKVSLLDVSPRLHSYHGPILIRRLRQPLSPEQSADLRHFAEAQEGKDFSLGRILLQGTPLRPRYGLRRCLLGRTCLDRDRWICSELVAAALTAAHLLDPREVPANSVYPRDFAYDERYDLSCLYHPAARWVPEPKCPGACSSDLFP